MTSDDVSRLGPITFRVANCAICRREAKVFAIERVTDASDKDDLQTKETRICAPCMKWSMEAQQAPIAA